MLVELVAAATIAAAGPAPVLPQWMAGCWMQRAGPRWTEECWSRPRGGMMIGYGWSGTAQRVTEWEAMQITVEQDARNPGVRMAYWASPGGTDRTLFTSSPGPESGVTFTNAAHDYPQRIRYWRDGRYLMAETSLKDGSKPKRWRYNRQAN